MAVFGPLFSRRFGMSLGVDVVAGDVRECNFDCLYCELKTSKKTAVLLSPEDPKTLIEAVQTVINSGVHIDVITVTANGEPTIYPYLSELVDGLNGVKTTQKTLILSNGSTICNAAARESLMKFDIVKLSLDSARSESYKKIDRPIEFDLDATIDCMASFAKNHQAVILETLFVKNINDAPEDISKLKNAYQKISPLRIDLSTIDRPPAYDVTPIDEVRLYEIADLLEFENISVATRKNSAPLSRTYSKDEWLNTLSKRPLTKNDARFLADDESYKIFLNLIENNTLAKKSVAGIDFFEVI